MTKLYNAALARWTQILKESGADVNDGERSSFRASLVQNVMVGLLFCHGTQKSDISTTESKESSKIGTAT